jgi:hypothetical protein
MFVLTLSESFFYRLVEIFARIHLYLSLVVVNDEHDEVWRVYCCNHGAIFSQPVLDLYPFVLPAGAGQDSGFEVAVVTSGFRHHFSTVVGLTQQHFLLNNGP